MSRTIINFLCSVVKRLPFLGACESIFFPAAELVAICISLASRFFLHNALQSIPKREATITVSFFLEDRNHIPPPFGRLYNVSFDKKGKGITYVELLWFMKPFAWYGNLNSSRIELPPCSTSNHAFCNRISRDAYNVGSGCKINYFNYF